MPDKQSSSSTLDVMHQFSKLIIVFPLIIVVAALLLKVEQQIPFLNSKTVPSPTPSPVVQVVVSPTPEEKTVKLDLKGPYSCQYSEKDQSAQAYIKDKNISLQITKGHGENILLNGDCLYKWEPGMYTGEKMCGISTYVALYETLSAVGGIDLGTILNMAESSQMSASVSASFIQNTLDSCKKQDVNSAVFTVPAGVSFKEIQPADSSTNPAGGMGSLDGIGALLKGLGGK